MFYVEFEYANYAHLYQYCLYQAIMRYCYAEKLFEDLSFDFFINDSGNLVLVNLPSVIDLSKIKITKDDVEIALMRISVYFGRKVLNSDISKLAKLIEEAQLRKLPTEMIRHFENDSLESPLLSFEEHEKDNASAELHVDIEANNSEEAVVAAILLEPFLDALSREVYYSNNVVLSSRSGDQIYISSMNDIDCERIIDSALSSLHKQKFDEICKNNIDYLIKSVDIVKIFDYSGTIVAKEKAVSLLKACDINSALRAIKITY